MSEVVDISPVNLDSNLWFIQPTILQDIPAYKLNQQGDNIQAWCTPFPILNKSIVQYLVLTVASWPAYRPLRRKARWSVISISLRIFQFVVINTVKDFSVVNKAEVDVFLERPLAFSMIQWMLAIWSLVPLSLQNSDCTSDNSRFRCCWSLACRILSITLLALK